MPFPVQFALILMDTQGIGDKIKAMDQNVDNMLLYTSLQFSTLQLLNVMKYLRAEDIRALQVGNVMAMNTWGGGGQVTKHLDITQDFFHTIPSPISKPSSCCDHAAIM